MINGLATSSEHEEKECIYCKQLTIWVKEPEGLSICPACYCFPSVQYKTDGF